MSEKPFKKVSASTAQAEGSTCGIRRRLIKKDDGAPASITRLQVLDAKPHWHKKTHEYYYVLEGTGVLVIGEDRVPVEPGDCVWIEPGVMHHAEGTFEALIIAAPAFDSADMFLDPPEATP